MTVLFAQLVGVSVPREGRDPEDVKQVVGNTLAGTIAEVEGLGGTVTSVSGAGLAAVFGAPEAHEDDPERAVRAGFRMMSVMAASGTAAEPEPLSVRVGIESGTAIVGPLWSAGGSGYGAAGAVVETAAVLQWAAKPGSVLVGPATRMATEGIFKWGPAEEVVVNAGSKPLKAVYLERPHPPRPGGLGQRGRRATAPWSGGNESCQSLTTGAPPRHLGRRVCRLPGGGARVGQDAAGARVPEPVHGLGRRSHRPAAALVGGQVRVLRFVNPVRSLPATPVRMDRCFPRREGRGCVAGTGPRYQSHFSRGSGPPHLSGPHDGPEVPRRGQCH